jgi:hypothetical protein
LGCGGLVQLAYHKHLIAEALRRDHRKLGQVPVNGKFARRSGRGWFGPMFATRDRAE